ncbi:type 1 glutamine amidotransferase [Marinilabilia rubra]|uniref:Amidotransferase n=1 Tax=Marinilabilia rubra TaxID=2162893 RepID=A0A2U2B509_9BACT|nr:type 1 glutamine amidotransferase [Marinilabilia rubra]PWD98145.1 amidotransferase [Marinilabilia rubra]
MPLKIHCFQQAPFEDPGYIKDWIDKKGHSLSYTRFYKDFELPSIYDYDCLVIMGGPMGVSDEDKYPWLADEKKAIKEAIENNKKVLGICLGSQLIASVLGARVYKNPETEIGWFDVSLTEEGHKEDLLDSFPSTFKVFQWHGDTFELPEGARHLASSEVCKNQAFIYKENVVGLQFHFEVTHDSLEQMLDGADDELRDAPFIQSKDDIQKNSHYINETNQKMHLILDRIIK